MKLKLLLKALSLTFLGLGVFILVQVAMPLLTYTSWQVSALDKQSLLISPTSMPSIEGVAVQNMGNFPAFVSNGFKGSYPYTDFKLSIPSIDLVDIPVKVASNTFDQTLAQLPGTALPGERGNVFISGHSSLPQWTDSSHTKAYFVRLNSLKKGGQVLVSAGGQQFSYLVEGLRVVEPQETWVVAPPDSTGRFLSLMTCVPPGFNSKRLVVLARLKK